MKSHSDRWRFRYSLSASNVDLMFAYRLQQTLYNYCESSDFLSGMYSSLYSSLFAIIQVSSTETYISAFIIQ